MRELASPVALIADGLAVVGVLHLLAVLWAHNADGAISQSGRGKKK